MATIIDKNTLEAYFSKSGFIHDYNRYAALIAKYRENPDSVSEQDCDFIDSFATLMQTADDVIAAKPAFLREFLTNHSFSHGIDKDTKKNRTFEDIEYPLLPNLLFEDDDSKPGDPLTSEKQKEILRLFSLGFIPRIEKIISNPDKGKTVVLFSDDSKSCVTCCENDTFDPITGVLIAILKRAMGPNHLHELIACLEETFGQPCNNCSPLLQAAIDDMPMHPEDRIVYSNPVNTCTGMCSACKQNETCEYVDNSYSDIARELTGDPRDDYDNTDICRDCNDESAETFVDDDIFDDDDDEILDPFADDNDFDASDYSALSESAAFVSEGDEE